MQIQKIGSYSNNNNQSKPAFKMELEGLGGNLKYLKQIKKLSEDLSTIEAEVLEYARTLKPESKRAFSWLSLGADGVKFNAGLRQDHYSPKNPQVTATNENWIPVTSGKIDLDTLKAALIEVVDKLSAKAG